MSVLRTSPTQKRSVERLAMIIDAGRQVLAEVGRDRITTAMVAEAAGGSIGSFYRYFPDRVALLDAIAPDRDLDQQKLERAREIFYFIRSGDHELSAATLDATMQALWSAIRPTADELSAEELAKVHAFGLDVAEQP